MVAAHTPTKSRRILVTGANRGIGFATAVYLARRGHRLMLAARRAEDLPFLETRFRRIVPTAEASFHFVDLASFDSIRRFATRLSGGEHIDVLLHNAGIILPSEERQTTEDGLEVNLAVAAVGPMLLSLALKPVLARPSRIIGVNSALHKPGSFGDEVAFQFDDPNLTNGYTRSRAYKNAKLAQLWFLFEWERQFGAEGLHTDAISPGFVPSTAARTARGMQWFLLRFVWPLLPFSTSVTKAAVHVGRVCERDLDEPGGRHFEGERLSDPSADARSRDKAIAFWTIAASWLGIEGSSESQVQSAVGYSGLANRAGEDGSGDGHQ